MAKVLIVGDTHVVPDEMDDCTRLLDYVIQVCRENGIDRVWFSGDQHHNHGLVNLKVVGWWRSAIYRMKNNGVTPLFLVGNHDQDSPGSNLHAMLAYEDIPLVTIVDRPTEEHGILLLPYMHTQEEFVKACQDSNATTVFCHQTFNGSMYENGMYAKDGFDTDLIPQTHVISGHIHTGQEFGKVWYVGSPRWRSLSDANTERAVWVLEIEDGVVTGRTPFSTGAVCRQIFHREDTPESPVELPLDLKHQWRIDIKGPADWCESRKKELAKAGARVRVFPEQISTKGMVKESEGIEKAFMSYLSIYQPKNGTATEVLEKMAKERLKV